MITNNAVILARVSSEEQTDNFSTPAQIRRAKEYCQKKDLRVLEVFEFTESATKGKRKVFWEVMDFIESKKVPVALVVDCVDRLMRGYREIAYLEDKITSGKLEIHFIQDSLILDSRTFLENTGIWEMKILMARQYAVAIMKNTRRGNEEARHRGEAFRVPVGYIRKDNIVTLHPKSHIITELFHNIAFLNWTSIDCYNYVKENGLELFTPTSILNQKVMQYISRIINNTFYYGEVSGGKHNYEHKYPKLTTKEVFYLAQEKIKARNKNRKRINEYESSETGVIVKPFVYRGLIKCEGCGWHLTGYERIKKYTTGVSQTFTYYRCCNRDCAFCWKQISEKQMHKKVSDTLMNIKISSVTKQALIAYVKKMIELASKDNNRGLEMVKEELESVTRKIDKLLDLLTDEHITKEEYLEKKSTLVEKQKRLVDQMSSVHNDKSQLLDVAVVVINACHQLSDIWDNAENHTKIELIKKVCVNLTFNPRKTKESFVELKKPFLQLSKKGSNLQENHNWLHSVIEHRTLSTFNIMTNDPQDVKGMFDLSAFMTELYNLTEEEKKDILGLKGCFII